MGGCAGCVMEVTLPPQAQPTIPEDLDQSLLHLPEVHPIRTPAGQGLSGVPSSALQTGVSLLPSTLTSCPNGSGPADFPFCNLAALLMGLSALW